MTPDRTDRTPNLDENGVLDDSGTVDTSGIGMLGGPWTAQVSVSLPAAADEEELVDDVVDDGVPLDEIADAAFPPIGEDRAVIDAAPQAFDAPEDESDETITAEVVEDEAHEARPVSGTPVDDIEDAELAAEDAEPLLEDPAPAGEAEPVEDAVPRPTADDTTVDADPEDAEAPAARLSSDDVDAPGAAQQWEDEAVSEVSDDSTSLSVADAQAASAAALGALSPATRREAHHTDEIDRLHDAERVHPPAPELALTSKRLDEFEVGRETSDLLTPDRLLDPARVSGPEPEGRWQSFVYSISGRRINLGDSKRARARKELDRRIGAPLNGGARFVPVLSRKGGVGKTTVTTLLGMALADARDDRVIAIDANPDRGTLAERIARPSGRTVRDLVRDRADVNGYNDISTIVARDETRLDVIASDSDPRVSEAFSDRDYHDVASIAAHYYSIVLTDTGTGIVHSVMGATLELSDQIVVVAGLSVDEARLASETLTWLETNGYSDQVRSAVVVLNTARPGAPLVRQDELEAHFRTRVRDVVRMPYDPLIATGSAIVFRDLHPATRDAARQLAAIVVEGLRTLAPAA